MKILTAVSSVAAVILSVLTAVSTGASAPAQPFVAASTVVVSEYTTCAPTETIRNTKAAYALTQQEEALICSVVMAESGAESLKGQKAVAQCILNACRKENMRPGDILGKYGYSKKRPTPSESVKSAVKAVFQDGETVLHGNALYFYAPKYGYSAWHESQRYVTTIGGHKFFASWN